jgi:hypothetical protein
MNFLSIALLMLSIWCWSGSAAQARVYSIDGETLAPYIGGTWGPGFENNGVSLSSSNTTTPITLNVKHSSSPAGEFGIVYSQKAANIRFGLEILRPVELEAVPGKDVTQAELYTLTSEVSVLIPKMVAELNIKKWSASRVILALGAGYANMAGRNSYAFTSTGNSTYPGMTDFYEDLRANSILSEGSLGFESVLSDTTTYYFQAGYRQLNFTEMKHNREVTTFQGPVNKGDLAKNSDGTSRSLDLSNYFVGISFRFWIH